MNKSKFTKFRKGAIAALCAVAVTCTGIAAACNPDTDPDDGQTSTLRKEDTQLLKNGNFEYAEVPEGAVHLIKNVTNWTRAGDSSGAMSGIINTAKDAWDLMSAYELMEKLEYNNDLSPDDSDYEENHKDYNGMDTSDILYIEPYAASLTEKFGDEEDGYAKNDVIRAGGKQRQRSYREFLGIEETANGGYTFRGKTVYLNEDDGDYYFDQDWTKPVRYEIIANPETHYGAYKTVDGKHYLGDNQILVDDEGNYYFDLDNSGDIDVLEDESVGNVLMIHNYPTNSKYNGIEQHYSSHSITLEANTAAEISLWVKTSDLKFDKGYLLNGDPVIGLDQQDRGAYIEVTQSVSSTTIDSFMIKAINTEKIIADNKGKLGENESNGWLKYTIYVNACDFADSTITINLGLGGTDTEEKVTGYAFFDDVEVKKYIDLEEGTYSDDVAKTIFDTENGISYCSLISDTEEKIFYADKQTIPGAEDDRFSTRFHYLVDLASEEFATDSNKEAIAFDNAGLDVSVALTYETSSGKDYASAEGNNAHVSGLTRVDGEYKLPDSMKDAGGRPTFNDLIGIYNSSKTEFTENDFDKQATDDSGRGNAFRNLSARLNPVLTGESGIAALKQFCGAYGLGDDYNGSMLLTLSAYGAAYTTTVQNAEGSNLLTVEGTKSENNTNYRILSFWVKTSDMDGAEAATIKLIDADDEDNVAIISVDSTNVTTNVGDEEDIYNGWVQCFFFIKNDTKTDKSFKLEFSFGNINIVDASATSFNYGWAAMANIQSLAVTEDVFDIVTESNYAKILTFADETPKSHNVFDSTTRMHNVKKEIADPYSYNGVNGGSSYVTDKKFGDAYDRQNNNGGITGLINREGFEEDGKYSETLREEILGSFVKGAANWNDVFGEQCYQPLIIVDNLREYYDRATTTEAYFNEHKTEFYIKGEDGGYRQVTAEDKWDKNQTYYSKSELVKNYGYIGSNETVSAGSYKTISVRVMVTGDAEAWIYLVDTSSADVMTFDLPEYTYYYDDEGNVLSEAYDAEWTNEEHSAAIVYSLRTDGLYDGKDGGVYANLANLTKRFKYPKFERNTFYKLDKDGNSVEVRYDDLEDGVTYYNDAACKVEASHYLCADGQRVYEYDSASGTYYYLVNGERSTEVKNFDTQYARPYSLDREPTEYEYAVKVENTGVDESGKPQWVTVNFVIHTGENDMGYRLELWSGKRDETGVTEDMTIESEVNGAVAFDYSLSAITESNAADVLAEYESNIKEVYRELIFAKGGAEKLDKAAEDMNITYLENILDELKVSAEDRKDALKAAGLDEEFVAEYYTYSWYDSAEYIPFNQETADAGQTGYGYTATVNEETLVYFKTRDLTNNSYNVFVDYSVIDQTLTIDSAAEDVEDDHDDDNGTSPDWLQITSIVLVAVLLFVLIAILVRYLWKNYSKKRGQKKMQKNNYKQRERYIRKLGLVKTAPVEEEPVEEASTEEPVEQEPVEETSAEEVPAEETPVEEAPSAEEAPAEDTTAEEVPAKETNAENENKDE